MNRKTLIVAVALIGLPLLADARPRVVVGVGIGVPGYYGYAPGYYYGPGYYYAPDYYYPPAPAVIYEAPPAVAQQAPAASWYYCPAAKGYYPAVHDCPGGWQAVPAQAQAAVAAPAPAAPTAASKTVYRLGDLLFAPGHAELKADAEATLRSLIVSLKQEAYGRIMVEGYTDSSGDQARNHELSQQRAESVKRYLVAHGLPADRITAVGKGEADPIAGNDTPEGRRLNRRVDVIVS